MPSDILPGAFVGAAFALIVGCAAGPATETRNPDHVSVEGFGGSFQPAVVSYTEVPFLRTERQAYDFSCGSAAVATLLTYHYGLPTEEQQVYLAMWNEGDRERITTEGFSMLDLRNYVRSRGLDMEGFRLSLDQLQQEGVPAITLINRDGFNHFVVIKGVTDNTVLVGDPFRGAGVYSREEFEGYWNGIVLAVRNQLDYARETFNADVEYAALRPDGRPGEGIDRDLIRGEMTQMPFGLQIRNQVN
jgi:predicted double-glycine peptidase